MRRYLKRAIFYTLNSLLIVFVGNLATAADSDQPRKPNVLFIMADDLNCRLGAYGDSQAKTPNLDKLAGRGVTFERAYCQFPLCSPSRSSLLTGRRPNVTGVLRNPGGPNAKPGQGSPHFREAVPETVTLPQLFKNNGYYVARVGKMYHYGVPNQIGTNGLDDAPSWGEVFNPKGRDRDEEDKIFSLVPKNFGGNVSWYAADGTDEEQTDGLSATKAIELLEQHKNDPFFLAVGFFRPHTPYVAPKPYFEKYPVTDIVLPEVSEADRARLPAPAFASAKAEQDKMSDAQRREAIQAYRASISFMDAQVGRVLDKLEQLGLAENTIVVFASDHGYHLHDHGLWQKMSLFENSARVPLIVASPGQTEKGKKSQSLAELVDIYPTIADLAKLPLPEYLDGKSLRPVLQDASQQVKQAAFTQVRRGQFDGYSVRTERYRFTQWDGGSKGEQLFDLENDPQETKNLATDPAHAEQVKELSKLLKDYAKK